MAAFVDLLSGFTATPLEQLTILERGWCQEQLGERFGDAYFDWYQQSASLFQKLIRELLLTARDLLNWNTTLQWKNEYRAERVIYHYKERRTNQDTFHAVKVTPTLLQILFFESLSTPVLLFNLVRIVDHEELPLRGFALTNIGWRFLGEPTLPLLYADKTFLPTPRRESMFPEELMKKFGDLNRFGDILKETIESEQNPWEEWTSLDKEWCLAQLGPTLGLAYFDSYQKNREELKLALHELFTEIRTLVAAHTEYNPNAYHWEVVLDRLPPIPIFTKILPTGFDAPVTPTLLQKLFLSAMREPLPFLFNVVLHREKEEISMKSFAFIDGKLRFLGEPVLALLYANQELLPQAEIALQFDDDEAGLRAMARTLLHAIKSEDFLTIRRLLEQSRLPNALAFFSALFDAERAKQMATRYEEIFSRKQEALMESFYAASGPEAGSLVSAELSDPEKIQASFGSPLKRAWPLGSIALCGLHLEHWVYQAGAWRFCTPLPRLVRFGETELDGLICALIETVSDNSILFKNLFTEWRPSEAKIEWFQEISQNPENTVTFYQDRLESSRKELVHLFSQLQQIKDIKISCRKSQRGDAWGIFIALPDARVLGLAPMLFRDGAWRFVGEVFWA